jgi:hypothetical protein
MYALAASRHMHEYGTTREQLAEVAVAAREWARLNPKAFMRDALTVQDVLASRMVSATAASSPTAAGPPSSLAPRGPWVSKSVPSTCSGLVRHTGTAT